MEDWITSTKNYTTHTYTYNGGKFIVLCGTLDRIIYYQAEHISDCKRRVHLKKFNALSGQLQQETINPETVIHKQINLKLDKDTKKTLTSELYSELHHSTVQNTNRKLYVLSQSNHNWTK